MSYRVNFLVTCLEEIADSENEELKRDSMAHKISRLDMKDYDKILNSGKSSDSKKESIEVNHEANIKQALGK